MRRGGRSKEQGGAPVRRGYQYDLVLFSGLHDLVDIRSPEEREIAQNDEQGLVAVRPSSSLAASSIASFETGVGCSQAHVLRLPHERPAQPPRRRSRTAR